MDPAALRPIRAVLTEAPLADCGDAEYQLTPEHGGLYGPRVSGPSEWHTPHASQAFMDYFLAKATEVVDQYRPDLVYFGRCRPGQAESLAMTVSPPRAAHPVLPRCGAVQTASGPQSSTMPIASTFLRITTTLLPHGELRS